MNIAQKMKYQIIDNCKQVDLHNLYNFLQRPQQKHFTGKISLQYVKAFDKQVVRHNRIKITNKVNCWREIKKPNL